MGEVEIPSSALPTTVGMRRMLAAAALLVFIIGLPTYLLPEETATLFSWTVNPPITAAFLGGGYLTSMFVEFLASRERTWANARIAVPAVLLFSTLTSIVTVRHLDKFHFGSGFSVLTQLITWVWLVVYVVVPPVVATGPRVRADAPGLSACPSHARCSARSTGGAGCRHGHDRVRTLLCTRPSGRCTLAMAALSPHRWGHRSLAPRRGSGGWTGTMGERSATGQALDVRVRTVRRPGDCRRPPLRRW
jgi:hypothetical protein